jgi:hypothetical protein
LTKLKFSNDNNYIKLVQTSSPLNFKMTGDAADTDNGDRNEAT